MEWELLAYFLRLLAEERRAPCRKLEEELTRQDTGAVSLSGQRPEAALAQQ